jgi:hypothetical protein
MQIHPASPQEAVKHTIESLAAGYIGLDFAGEVGDLHTIQQSSLPANQRHYWGFAHEMKEGDLVLILAHHFPFALAKVYGPYNYIRSEAPEIGVWFRHFRKVSDVRYYADFKTDAHAWEKTTMTATITQLRDPDSNSYRLIGEWAGSTS